MTYCYQGLRLATAPATEPLSVATFRTHAKIDDDDEDTLLGTYITTARMWAERVTGRALVLQTWDMYYDMFPAMIVVPKPPLSSVTWIKYIDTDGTLQTMSSSLYDVDTYSEPGRIIPAYEEIWPTTRSVQNAVQVRFVAGYEGTADPTPDYSLIPQSIIHAIQLMVATWDQQREGVILPDISATQYNELPLGARQMLNQHRIHWF